MDRKRKIKEKIASKRSDVNIGKKGIYEGLLNEIKRRLKSEGVIKVRILKSALKSLNMDRFKIAEEVAKLVNAKLIAIRGRTFILEKKKVLKNEKENL